MRAGAVDVLAKPGGPSSVAELATRLKQRVRAIRGVAPASLVRAFAPATSTTPPPVVKFDSVRRWNGVIAIGASTGGPQAIETLLTPMPAESPPVVITQHMPAGFTKAFTERLIPECFARLSGAAVAAR